MFKPGDLVRGLPSSNYKYSITNEQSICEVLKVEGCGYMRVKVLTRGDVKYNSDIAEFSVNQKYFESAIPKEPATTEELMSVLLGGVSDNEWTGN